ncbi:ABC transporter substrate-binding protein [Bradyrhizobium barranii subsp. apii]|uniref:ABC transporter substrate-binding protein n=1 Tax=Bradyrhizobium barranii subsp. apii TaxID=2819348 RepID=A0A8T5VD40_9BRAD|nr:ABC transporter substrate-binding protein [Bradyrhizobium barranii]UPT84612.1 ABC transporter substrate-binding protein [Bradyrhizobium barranii subsp. apii]
MTYKTGLIGLLMTVAFASAASAHDDDLVIGLSMARTGTFVSVANANEIAVDMAVDEINRAGGVNGLPLKVVKFDTAGDPKQAVLAVEQFARDAGALAVVGPFSSSEARVAFSAGERLGISQMSMSSSAPGVAAPFKFAFRNTVDEGLVIETVLSVMRAKGLGMRTAAIAYATDDAVSKAVGTAVLPEALLKVEVPVSGFVDFPYKAFDMSAQVSKLAQLKPDIVGVGAPPEAMINLAKEMKRQGVNARLFAGTTVGDPDLPVRFGDAGEGTIIGSPFYSELNDAVRAFAKSFAVRAEAAKIGRTVPNQTDISSYDIVYMYAEAMKRARVTGEHSKLASERGAIKDELRKMKDYPALGGKITFRENGDAVKPIYVLEAKGGRWTLFDQRSVD